MRRLGRLFSIGFLVIVTSVVVAQSPLFLSESDVDPVKLLPPPPSDQSAETKAELDLLLRIQDRRTPQEIARAKADSRLTLAAFAGVLGPWFTPENLPQMEKLFQELDKEAAACGERGRKHFGRKRPQFLDERIKPSIEGHRDPCYPSGNSTRGMLCAAVLAELAPQQREALFERGRDIGWSRIIAGVHYPSDVTAGRVLGLALARALLANPQFQGEFAKVKEEFDAVKKSKGTSG